jgi:hypothetical protein
VARTASVSTFLKIETEPAELEHGDFVCEDVLYREYRLWAYYKATQPVGLSSFRKAMDKAGHQREQHDRPGGKHWDWRVETWEEELYHGGTKVHRERVPFSVERGDGPHFLYRLKLRERRSWVVSPQPHERRRSEPIVARQVRVLEDVQYKGEVLAAGTIVDQLQKRKHEEHRPDTEEIIIDWMGIRRWIDVRAVAAVRA